MNIVEAIKHALLALGAAPVMWLMLALSIASVAVILERAWLFARMNEDIDALGRALRAHLRAGDLPGAQDILRRSPSIEASIVGAGLEQLPRGEQPVREAMAAETLLARNRLERGLDYLGTLASNAPFIGLFGTVIGIVLAFEELGATGAKGSASAAVMAAIAEALVATAVGIGVAVPAVIAFNAYQRRIRVILDRATALGHVLLVHAEGAQPARAGDDGLLGEATAALAVRTGTRGGN